MSKHSSRWRAAAHKLGRSTTLIVIAALLFLANVVINLFSTAIESPLKQQIGASRYPTALAVALVVCLGLAAAVYLYDHRRGAAEQDRDEAVPSDPAIDRRNRQVFISDMRRRFAERLESAPKLIRLRLAERMGVVEPPGVLIRPYDLARHQPGQPDELLPAHARIIDLYDEHNAQILILGAPGAGKTILLYELARDLVERAAADEAAPVPVVFALATWQPGQVLDDWLIADLAQRYGAKPALISHLLRLMSRRARSNTPVQPYASQTTAQSHPTEGAIMLRSDDELCDTVANF